MNLLITIVAGFHLGPTSWNEVKKVILINKEITINKDINGRQAANFVHAVTSKPYNIWFKNKNKEINAKSILGLLSADIHKGDRIVVEIDCDEQLELDDIERIINN